jgi:hypothetical protein
MPLHVQRARPAGLIHNALAPIRAELVGVSLATCPTAGVYRPGLGNRGCYRRVVQSAARTSRSQPRPGGDTSGRCTATSRRPTATPANRHTATRRPVQHPSDRSGKRGITDDLHTPTTAIGAAASRAQDTTAMPTLCSGRPGAGSRRVDRGVAGTRHPRRRFWASTGSGRAAEWWFGYRGWARYLRAEARYAVWA